jgi:hypothetical protein
VELERLVVQVVLVAAAQQLRLGLLTQGAAGAVLRAMYQPLVLLVVQAL